MTDSSWIWTGGAKPGNQPAGPAYFRKVIQLPTDRKLSQATVLIAADDGFSLFVNGHASGNGSNWKTPANLDVTGQLTAGANVGGNPSHQRRRSPSPAGLIGKVIVLFDSGEPLVIPIDASWRSTREPGEHWTAADYDDTKWTESSVIARHGDAPWGELQLQIVRMRPASFLRKEFAIDKPLRSATLFASALGVYELQINGHPLNADVLSPGWTDYHKRVHYFGYNITRAAWSRERTRWARSWGTAGTRATWRSPDIGITTVSGRDSSPSYIWNSQDGSRAVIATDGTWKAADGPIREADLLMGCVYDARRELPDWSTAGLDDSAWHAATVDKDVKANLQAHPGTPIRRMEELPALKVTQPQPGVYVFDLGQNMVGWARLQARGTPGQKVVVRHAEMLNPDGTLYTTNLRRPKPPTRTTWLVTRSAPMSRRSRFTGFGTWK